jgi:hypothetical protein
MISNADLFFILCLIISFLILFSILFLYKNPYFLSFALLVILMLSALSVLGYYLNVQINSIKNNQDTTDIDLSIINNYLLEISPWILLGDENQQPITYPGI